MVNLRKHLLQGLSLKGLLTLAQYGLVLLEKELRQGSGLISLCARWGTSPTTGPVTDGKVSRCARYQKGLVEGRLPVQAIRTTDVGSQLRGCED